MAVTVAVVAAAVVLLANAAWDGGAAQAWPFEAGTCGPGKAIATDTTSHGPNGSGSLSDGQFTVEIGEISLDPGTVASIVAGTTYDLRLSRSNDIFKGFLFRLAGTNGEDAEGSFIVKASGVNSPLSQIMSNTGSFLSTCDEGVAGLSHTSAFSSSSTNVAVSNFVKISAGGNYTLDVTVVEQNIANNRNAWYFETYAIEVKGSGADSPTSAGRMRSVISANIVGVFLTLVWVLRAGLW